MAEDLSSVVLAALEVEDPNILRAACVMAGSLKLAQAERALLKALNHKAWQVQMEAVRALGRLGAHGSVPFMRRMLKASDADIRQKILTGAAGSKAGTEGEDLNPEVRRALAIAISRLSPKIAQDALWEALSSDQPTLLNAAIAGLANLECAAAGERMIELLDHKDTAVRRAAAASLGKLREEKAAEKLIDLLRDQEAEVRKEAVIALNHLKNKKALPHMALAMDDPSPEVRRVCAIALGNAQSKEGLIVQPLLKGLDDRDPGVRQACLSSLGNLKIGAALEACCALLGDTHEAVARQAAVTVVALAQYCERPDYEKDFSVYL
jgi:HEAT repeat protein